jgi:peptidoglycan/xylan/chitin deacetylase (PgdA/CDA1 family)
MTLSRRDFLRLGGAAMLGLAARNFLPALQQTTPLAPTIWHGSRRHRYVALTFDDCAKLDRVQELEQIISSYPEVKITIFPLGQALVDLESFDHGIWKRFFDKGHDIGYHSWNHTNLAVMSPEGAIADYDRWHDALGSVLGVEPNVRFARPPYGVLSYSFDVMCKARGLVATMWSAAGGGETSVVMKNTFGKIQNGDIVLLHTRNNTQEDYVSTDMDTTKLAIPYLIEQGMPMVTLSKLYDDLLREQNQSDGCDAGAGNSATRTCID